MIRYAKNGRVNDPEAGRCFTWDRTTNPMNDPQVSLSILTDILKSVARFFEAQTEWLKHSDVATKRDLRTLDHHIMSAISEFATRQNAFNVRMDAAVTGLTGDVQALNDLITELQNTAGTITPEDQALLDDIDTRAAAIAVKLEALDALTPPPPPPAG